MNNVQKKMNQLLREGNNIGSWEGKKMYSINILYDQAEKLKLAAYNKLDSGNLQESYVLFLRFFRFYDMICEHSELRKDSQNHIKFKGNVLTALTLMEEIKKKIISSFDEEETQNILQIADDQRVSNIYSQLEERWKNLCPSKRENPKSTLFPLTTVIASNANKNSTSSSESMLPSPPSGLSVLPSVFQSPPLVLPAPPLGLTAPPPVLPVPPSVLPAPLSVLPVPPSVLPVPPPVLPVPPSVLPAPLSVLPAPLSVLPTLSSTLSTKPSLQSVSIPGRTSSPEISKLTSPESKLPQATHSMSKIISPPSSDNQYSNTMYPTISRPIKQLPSNNLNNIKSLCLESENKTETTKDLNNIKDLCSQNKNNNNSQDNYSKLAHNLKIRGFEIKNVPGDNNCQFHAIADQLNQVDIKGWNASKLRKKAVQWLKDNYNRPLDDGKLGEQTVLKDSIGISDWNNYIKEMSEHNVTWGDEATLLALSVLFKAEIVIISSLSEDYCHIVTPPEIWGVKLRTRLYLGHYHEFHYISTRIKN